MLRFHTLAQKEGYSYKDIRMFHPTAAAMEILAEHEYLWDEDASTDSSGKATEA